MKPALVVWGQGFSSNSSGGKKKQFDVRAIGEGSIGDIKVSLRCIAVYALPCFTTTFTKGKNRGDSLFDFLDNSLA